jgi:hypothetical protein
VTDYGLQGELRRPVEQEDHSLELFPLLPGDSGLPKDPGEQCDANVTAVWIGDAHRHFVSDHKLVLPA